MSLSVFHRHGKDLEAQLLSFATFAVRDAFIDISQHFSTFSSNAIRAGYAFTLSDMKTIVIPVTCYGVLSSPRMPELHTMLRLVTWVWLFLLQFCAANQMYNTKEDSINKPYRPIPAGLMTVTSAYALRWTLVLLCLYLSWNNGVLLPGISLTLAFIAYNEGGLDSRWYSKSLLNAIGIVSWDVGSAGIASAGHLNLTEKFSITPFLSVAIIWTTIHVQDFRDEVGDRVQGRITLPTLLPEASRHITFFLINAWSIGLGQYWGLSSIAYALFVSFGFYLSLRILLQRTEGEDKVSLRLYMLWLTIARTLPFLRAHQAIFR
ncbi:hypothetical protein E1B28_005750 [Marasmius oreades]|uniref:UbiA prenyltransferase n=1 Tax=Marasmius oreades TaxID=181124 RepID=A0A9P7S3W9_9AGAR|nr:uncharacterized protein E1B28_005750 [Marasmius oreades]KAG7094949.1 hypothetical protein E1B28_005750 [Marasmius oreades]